jgi:hypothetical protein
MLSVFCGCTVRAPQSRPAAGPRPDTLTGRIAQQNAQSAWHCCSHRPLPSDITFMRYGSTISCLLAELTEFSLRWGSVCSVLGWPTSLGEGVGSRPDRRPTFFASPKQVGKERRPGIGAPGCARGSLWCLVRGARAELAARLAAATLKQAARSQLLMSAARFAPRPCAPRRPLTGPAPHASLRIGVPAAGRVSADAC